MKLRFIITTWLLVFAVQANATVTWILLGDSIMSDVPGGTASQLSINLVSNERDVIFKSIASPGIGIGQSDPHGYNSPNIDDTLTRIGGFYSAYHGIMIQAGTNDYSMNMPWQNTYGSLVRIMTHARTYNKKVMVLDPIWRNGEDKKNTLGYDLSTYRYIMKAVCENDFQDVCKFAKRENTFMGTSAALNYYKAEEVANGTQLHPNATGHRYIADWIKAEGAAFGFF